MVEQDDGEKHQRAEEIKQELLGYLKDAEFGTPKYFAWGDCLDLQILKEVSSAF